MLSAAIFSLLMWPIAGVGVLLMGVAGGAVGLVLTAVVSWHLGRRHADAPTEEDSMDARL